MQNNQFKLQRKATCYHILYEYQYPVRNLDDNIIDYKMVKIKNIIKLIQIDFLNTQEMHLTNTQEVNEIFYKQYTIQNQNNTKIIFVAKLHKKQTKNLTVFWCLHLQKTDFQLAFLASISLDSQSKVNKFKFSLKIGQYQNNCDYQRYHILYKILKLQHITVNKSTRILSNIEQQIQIIHSLYKSFKISLKSRKFKINPKGKIYTNKQQRLENPYLDHNARNLRYDCIYIIDQMCLMHSTLHYYCKPHRFAKTYKKIYKIKNKYINYGQYQRPNLIQIKLIYKYLNMFDNIIRILIASLSTYLKFPF